MPKRDSDPLAEAMAATDREMVSEIFEDSAVHDETGDRSLEDQGEGLEGKSEEAEDETEVEAAEEDGEKTEAKAADKGPAKDPKTGKFVAKTDGEEKPEGEAEEDAEAAPDKDGRVPSHVVRRKTEQVKAAEARVAEANAKLAESDRRFAELNGKFDILARQFETRQQPPKVEAKTEDEPDMFADPDGWKAWNRRQTDTALATIKQENQAQLQEVTHRIVGQSFDAARSSNAERFDAAFNNLMAGIQGNNPEALLVRQRVFSSVNPGAELLRWHNRQELAREFGDDPTAAKQKIADETRATLLADPEFRKEILAALKKDAGGENGPRHVIRVPGKTMPSLNGASGSNSLRDYSEDPSDRGMVDEIWNNP